MRKIIDLSPTELVMLRIKCHDMAEALIVRYWLLDREDSAAEYHAREAQMRLDEIVEMMSPPTAEPEAPANDV